MTACDSVTVRRIRVRGQVQAVGFRPHVWRIARELDLAGEVANDGQGVTILAGGPTETLDLFEQRIAAQAPPLARIDAVESMEVGDIVPAGPFAIAQSSGGAVTTGITPDAATCPDCLAEIFAPGDRRRGYAFGNCTHCGPRLTIIRAIPYDRAQTSMAPFAMCPACAAEYSDPADRRFHAQPIACPDCGPRLWLEGVGEDAPDPLAETARILKRGGIVAIKGLGGFHLACDARNSQAVAELRRRKVRDAKPFALMATADRIAPIFRVGEEAQRVMASPAAPIVLLPRIAEDLPDALAPGQDHLGFMLPHAPLHHLLLGAFGGVLVMTSGNLSDEPQATTNEEARAMLAGLCDAMLMHDRDIVNRVDDSVVAFDAEGPMVMRRARGLAPAPIRMPDGLSSEVPILAMGGELKATFCMLRGDEAILSQHIGDLEDGRSFDDYRSMLGLYRDIYRFEPGAIAVDAHPDYLSTRLGHAMAEELGVPLVTVPHHHAHMASGMAENGLLEPCHGIVLDGLGMGDDGTLWGGEVLRGDLAQAERVAALPAVALAGGAAAMKQPWRNLVAHLRHAFGPDWRGNAAPLARFVPSQGAMVEQMIAKGINCPPCSSAGRLFDAVAAALGIHADAISHEGQAAMALEAMARQVGEVEPYPTGTTTLDIARIDLAPMWTAMAGDVAADADRRLISARFHAALSAAMVGAVLRDGAEEGARVILSGGVLHNRVLRQDMARRLRAAGLVPVVHTRIPASDGGLALGQAACVATRMTRRR